MSDGNEKKVRSGKENVNNELPIPQKAASEDSKVVSLTNRRLLAAQRQESKLVKAIIDRASHLPR